MLAADLRLLIRPRVSAGPWVDRAFFFTSGWKDRPQPGAWPYGVPESHIAKTGNPDECGGVA